jgi:hypothetical protein
LIRGRARALFPMCVCQCVYIFDNNKLTNGA